MDNQNKDRGTIKWTAMMLPEQVKMLREWAAEELYVSEPDLDEYEFEELAHQIQIAVQTHSLIRLLYWHNGKSFEIEGTINKLPTNIPYLIVASPQGKKIYIPHIIELFRYDM